MSNLAIALCGQPLDAEDGPPEWVRLIPIGEVKAVDGRKWRVSDPDAVVLLSGPGNGLLVDYDHGADRREGSTEAAGWIRELAVRDGFIWGRIEWTAEGARRVLAKQYRFISPVLLTNKEGAVRKITRAGLTNVPALPQLGALASEQTNDPLAEFLSALGLPETADGQTVIAQIKKLTTGEPDPSRYVPVEQVEKLVKVFAEERARGDRERVERKVGEAVAAGKVMPALRGWALSLCAANEAAFDEFVAKTVAIITPGFLDSRFAGSPPSSQGALPTAAATETVCKALGVTADAIARNMHVQD